MNCLVLGGGGFIGSHLCKALLENGHKVTIFERPRLKINSEVAATLEKSGANNALRWVEGDFTNEIDIKEAMKGIEVVFHLVSTTLPKNSNDNPCFDVESNVMATLKMLDAAVQNKVRKIIFISSGGTVYGVPKQIPIAETHAMEPICSYGITKLTIERYLSLYHYLYGIDYCVLRVSNPYGEWQRPSATQGVIAVFLDRILKNEVVEIWGDGAVIRDYIYIEDVVNAILKAMEYNQSQIFNIGSGQGHSLNDLLQVIESITGRKVQCSYQAARKLDVPVNVLDISKARKAFSWEPKTTLDDGILKTYHWMKNHFLVTWV